eukprot:5770530-Alexandrium_andersonii.AAC.1
MTQRSSCPNGGPSGIRTQTRLASPGRSTMPLSTALASLTAAGRVTWRQARSTRWAAPAFLP